MLGIEVGTRSAGGIFEKCTGGPECQQRCALHPFCIAFTFYSAHSKDTAHAPNSCVLKDNVRGRIASESAVSGVQWSCNDVVGGTSQKYDPKVGLTAESVLMNVRTSAHGERKRAVGIAHSWWRDFLPNSATFMTAGHLPVLTTAVEHKQELSLSTNRYILESECGDTHSARELCCKTRVQFQYWTRVQNCATSNKLWYCHADGEDDLVLHRKCLTSTVLHLPS